MHFPRARASAAPARRSNLLFAPPLPEETLVKFRVERDVFADAVAWAARSLPVRPSSPVLAGLLIEASDAGRRDRKSTRLNSSHTDISRMPSSA